MRIVLQLQKGKKKRKRTITKDMLLETVKRQNSPKKKLLQPPRRARKMTLPNTLNVHLLLLLKMRETAVQLLSLLLGGRTCPLSLGLLVLQAPRHPRHAWEKRVKNKRHRRENLLLLLFVFLVDSRLLLLLLPSLRFDALGKLVQQLRLLLFSLLLLLFLQLYDSLSHHSILLLFRLF